MARTIRIARGDSEETFGMSFSAALCLIAAVARWEAELKPATCIEIDAFLSRVEGVTTAGQELRPLSRLGFLERLGRENHRVIYKPTARGIRTVREWCGARERPA